MTPSSHSASCSSGCSCSAKTRPNAAAADEVPAAQQHAHSFPRVAALPLPSKTHIYARSPHPVPRSITYGQRHQRSPARARHQRRRHVLSHSRRFKSHATHPLCMCVWSFPTSSPSEEAKMLTRSGLHSASPQSCQLFYRVGKDWAYSCTVSDGGGGGAGMGRQIAGCGG